MKGRAVEEQEKAVLIERLLAAWKASPQQRLGQLLVNAAGAPGNDIFYVEDYALIERVEAAGQLGETA